MYTTISDRSVSTQQLQKVDIIWNITYICPWDCPICCVDAVHVSKNNGSILLKSNNLTDMITIPHIGGEDIYERAVEFRQKQRHELTFDEKIKILDNLEGVQPKIDFSGGDPLVVNENIEVMRIASERFGRDQITLTATGFGLARCDPSQVAPIIGELNFTYDGASIDHNTNRPDGYAAGNLKKATIFSSLGTRTRAECPLSIRNISESTLQRLYITLHENNIDKLLLMRLFPVGRGVFRSQDVPNHEQYHRAIATLREMESKLRTPKLKLQCALRFLEPENLEQNPCDLLKESLGLMADGRLLLSAWAYGRGGNPLDDAWVLGNLAETRITELLQSEKSQRYKARLDENFGHCKVLAFLNSARSISEDRIFDISDPLYDGRIKSVQLQQQHRYESRRALSLIRI